MNVKKLTGTAVFTALALVSFLIENAFPPMFVPGAKMGVSNIFTLLALLFYGGGCGLITVLVKCVLGCVFSGNASALMYSLPAGLVSFGVEFLLVRFAFGKVSVIALSCTAAVLHNAVQNIVFALVTGMPEVMGYLPYLALIGAVSGITVGAAVFATVKLLPEEVIRKQLN